MNKDLIVLKNCRPDIFVNIIGEELNRKITYKCPKCKCIYSCYISNLRKRKYAECMKCIMRSEKMRERLTQSSREYFTNPESIKMISKVIKKRWTNPIYRKKISEMKRVLWTDPIYRKIIHDVQSTELYKNRSSLRSKQLWENDDFRKKMNESSKKLWENSDFRKKMSEVSRKLWKNNDFRKKMSGVSRKLWENDDFRKIMSEKARKQCIEGGLYKGNSSVLDTMKGGIIRTKSSFETRYIKILEDNLNVLKFIYEPFYIDYEHNGENHFYTPDFLVFYKDRIELVEVKPLYFVNKSSNPAKFMAAEKYCITKGLNFVVITENEL